MKFMSIFNDVEVSDHTVRDVVCGGVVVLGRRSYSCTVLVYGSCVRHSLGNIQYHLPFDAAVVIALLSKHRITSSPFV